jgi:hypothetical protein
MIGVLVGLVLVGIGVVALRVDQSRTSLRIQRLQSDQVEVQRELWTQEMIIAELRSPRVIRDQAARLGLEITSSAHTAPSASPARTAGRGR